MENWLEIGFAVMNPAIEYALRVNLFENLIRFPCSIFIYKYENPNERIVLTLHRKFGEKKEDALIVKHWRLKDCQKNEILPPFSEFAISPNELHISDYTIIPGFQVLEYEPEYYPINQRQTSDAPYSNAQEKRYIECMEEFFYTKRHKDRRRDWLWSSFMTAFLPQSFDKVFVSHQINSQQSVIADNFPVIWKGWQMWTKYLLTSEGLVAPELVLSKSYETKLRQIGLWKEKAAKQPTGIVFNPQESFVINAPSLQSSPWQLVE